MLNKNYSTASKGTDLSLRKEKRSYTTSSKIENFVMEFYCSISFKQLHDLLLTAMFIRCFLISD